MQDLNSILLEGIVVKCKPLKDKFVITVKSKTYKMDKLKRRHEAFINLTIDCSKKLEKHITPGNRVRVVGSLIPVPRNVPIGVLAEHVEIHKEVSVKTETKGALCG